MPQVTSAPPNTLLARMVTDIIDGNKPADRAALENVVTELALDGKFTRQEHELIGRLKDHFETHSAAPWAKSMVSALQGHFAHEVEGKQEFFTSRKAQWLDRLGMSIPPEAAYTYVSPDQGKRLQDGVSSRLLSRDGLDALAEKYGVTPDKASVRSNRPEWPEALNKEYAALQAHSGDPYGEMRSFILDNYTSVPYGNEERQQRWEQNKPLLGSLRDQYLPEDSAFACVRGHLDPVFENMVYGLDGNRHDVGAELLAAVKDKRADLVNSPFVRNRIERQLVGSTASIRNAATVGYDQIQAAEARLVKAGIALAANDPTVVIDNRDSYSDQLTDAFSQHPKVQGLLRQFAQDVGAP